MCLMVSYDEHQCYNDAPCLFSFVCSPHMLEFGEQSKHTAVQVVVSEAGRLSDEGKKWYSCLSLSPSWADVEILTELNVAILMLLAV